MASHGCLLLSSSCNALQELRIQTERAQSGMPQLSSRCRARSLSTQSGPVSKPVIPLRCTITPATVSFPYKLPLNSPLISVGASNLHCQAALLAALCTAAAQGTVHALMAMRVHHVQAGRSAGSAHHLRTSIMALTQHWLPPAAVSRTGPWGSGSICIPGLPVYSI